MREAKKEALAHFLYQAVELLNEEKPFLTEEKQPSTNPYDRKAYIVKHEPSGMWHFVMAINPDEARELFFNLRREDVLQEALQDGVPHQDILDELTYIQVGYENEKGLRLESVFFNFSEDTVEFEHKKLPHSKNADIDKKTEDSSTFIFISEKEKVDQFINKKRKEEEMNEQKLDDKIEQARNEMEMFSQEQALQSKTRERSVEFLTVDDEHYKVVREGTYVKVEQLRTKIWFAYDDIYSQEQDNEELAYVLDKKGTKAFVQLVVEAGYFLNE